jgi:hypothetical protein
MDYFISTVTDKEIKKEKQKARDLRKTQWWKHKRAEGKCYYCGGEIPPKELTMDHIVPYRTCNTRREISKEQRCPCLQGVQ